MRDMERLAQAGIDYQEGLHRFAGQERLYEKYLTRFVADATAQQLAEAIRQGDAQNAFVLAHSWKGIIGNLSFHTLYDAVTPLVEALRAGDLAQAEALLPTVEQAHQQVLRALQ